MDSSSDDVDAMSIKAMKVLIAKAGLSCADCVEKSDIRKRTHEALEKMALEKIAEEEDESEDEIEDSDADEAPSAKRAKPDAKPMVYALLLSEGQTSLDGTSIVALFKTWAGAIKKAKHVLAWGESGKGGEFWNPVANGGYIPEDEDDEYGDNLEYYEDKTDKSEPKGGSSVEVASAKHGEGDYGNMSMCIQKVALCE